MLLGCAVLVTVAASCPAEPIVTPTEMVIRLKVQPMPAPKPALRYALLPEVKELQPGNPVPNYLKCFMSQDFTPANETLGRAALREADRAARMDKPDWQLTLRIKTDGIGLLLPDVQKIRELAAGLQTRFRQELAQGRFDDAVVTAKTMFAISRHLSEHPTLIGDLVGIAIAFIAIGPFEEMLEQTGCPNFYWALTNLPNPMIPLDKGMDGERTFVLVELRDLDDRAPMTPDQLKKLIEHIDKIRDLGRGKPEDKDRSTRAFLDARVKDEKIVNAARTRLLEFGLLEEQVLRFPADQVILLDERREYEVRRDEVMKLMNLPAWQCEAYLGGQKPSKEPALFEFFIPAVSKVRRAQARLEQRIALLRHVEALRLHAAQHDGQLPTKLSEISVPLPLDPFTGQPFRYTLEGNTAHLRGSPPPGAEKEPAYNVHYEVTIQK
jgi:hypothetical protein